MPRRGFLSPDFQHAGLVKEVSYEDVSLVVKVGKRHTGPHTRAELLLQLVETRDQAAEELVAVRPCPGPGDIIILSTFISLILSTAVWLSSTIIWAFGCN